MGIEHNDMGLGFTHFDSLNCGCKPILMKPCPHCNEEMLIGYDGHGAVQDNEVGYYIFHKIWIDYPLATDCPYAYEHHEKSHDKKDAINSYNEWYQKIIEENHEH